ncbi:hypothetical protein GEMRC1_001844 [Eukaryota sp. GEM-RC1]
MLKIFKPEWLVGSYTYSSIDICSSKQHFCLGCHTHILIGLVSDLLLDIPTDSNISVPSTAVNATSRIQFPQKEFFPAMSVLKLTECVSLQIQDSSLSAWSLEFPS